MNIEKTPRTVIMTLRPLLMATVAFCNKLGIFPSFVELCNSLKEFHKFFKAFEEGNYELAFRILKPIADSDACSLLEPTLSSVTRRSVICMAPYYIGLMYFHGKGVAQHFDSGIYYFRKAALLGHPEAIQYLKDVGLEQPAS